jgi:hypothetical protein
MTMHPTGYARTMVTLTVLRGIHEPKMHPEFARRLFRWLGAHDGIGIGGGFRISPAPGGAPLDKSFHYYQDFASGTRAYAAVDLVIAQLPEIHRSPTWAESADAPEWGLHTFIRTPKEEPWHMQAIEMRGWQTWVDRGRLDPIAGIPLPGDYTPPPPPKGIPMSIIYRVNEPDGSFVAFAATGAHVGHFRNGNNFAAAEKVWPVQVLSDGQQIVDAIESGQRTTPCPPAWIGTIYEAVWLRNMAPSE